MTFQIFDIGKGLRAEEILSAELVVSTSTSGVADTLPRKIRIIHREKIGIAWDYVSNSTRQRN